MDQRPDDAQLSAWLDGEGTAAEREQVAAWLEQHPDDMARVRQWATDRDALRAAFDPVLDERLPEALLSTARRHGRWWSGGKPTGGATLPGPRWAQAAAVVGLMATGGLIGAALVWQLAAKPAAQQAAATGPWTHRAAVAHAVYVPEVRHPVEVSVVEGNAAEQRAQEQHLARWLTKRLDMPVRLADLRPQGFELVGGRLLPDASGPSAQLMYQNGKGERITVYLRRPEPGSATAFRYQRDGDLGMFYWVEDGLGCALVGALPRERLLAAADAVYRQMEAAQAQGTASQTPATSAPGRGASLPAPAPEPTRTQPAPAPRPTS